MHHLISPGWLIKKRGNMMKRRLVAILFTALFLSTPAWADSRFDQARWDMNYWDVIVPLLPDTGQTKCYDNTGEIACPQSGQEFHGQDAQYTINQPSYTKLDTAGNPLPYTTTEWAMVRDDVTGLIWEVKQTKDENTDYSNPHDADNIYTWYDSNSETNGGDAGTEGDGTNTENFINELNSAGFGGYSDWRMPTREELRSIVDYGRFNPSVHTDWFPNTVASGYWSSTTGAYSSSDAERVYFTGGSSSYSSKSNSYSARAVRGRQSVSFDNLIINGDGTATDTSTGLIWQQTTAPEKMIWQSALSYCENLTLGGYNDWRLPTIKELASIVDLSRYNPAIDTSYFPDTYASSYWSSSTVDSITSSAWVVSFMSGLVGYYGKSNSDYVRAVRGGQNQISGNLFITSPQQASTWNVGSIMPITWETQSIAGNVSISNSRDGGKTFIAIAENTENDGSYNWTATGPVSVNCVLKIEPVDDSAKGTTQGLFTILEKKFVEFQTILTHGARDWESFSIDGETYLVVANANNDASYSNVSTIYKWSGSSFEEFQSIPTEGANSWESFTIGGTIYLAVANYRSDPTYNVDSKIYKWNGAEGQFEEFQSILTSGAFHWESFTIDGQTYIVVANSYNDTTSTIDSVIYKWNDAAEQFEEFQTITTQGAYDWESFIIDGATYIAVANVGDDITFNVDSVIYKWNEVAEQFEEFQTITTQGAYDWESFTIDGLTYLALANYHDDTTREIDSKIYKWNGANEQFEELQSIPSVGAKQWNSFSVDGENYLALANNRNDTTRNVDSKIYKWSGASFEEMQVISTNGATGLESIVVGGETYLVVANFSNDITHNIDSKIYKWSAFTVENQNPNTPSSPTPSDGISNVSIDTYLSWTGGDPDAGDTVTYNIYLDTVNPPVAAVASDQTALSFELSALNYNSTYYWRIVARDNSGAETEGPVWGYTTTSFPIAELSNTPNDPTNQQNINVTVGGQGVVSYKYKLDSGEWSADEIDVGTPISETGLPEGSHTLSVIGKNSSDSWQPPEQATIHTWTIDITDPAINSFEAQDASTSNNQITNERNVSIIMTGSDNSGTIARWLITESADEPTMEQMNAGATGAYATFTIQSPGDGEKTLYAWIMDPATNISTAAQHTIELDTATRVTIDAGDTCTAKSYTLLTGSMEEGATVEVTCSTATVGQVTYPMAVTWQVELTELLKGSHLVTATATDGAENQTSDQVTINRSIPTTATINNGTGELLADNGTSALQLTIDVKDGLDQAVCDGTEIEVTTTLGEISPALYTTTNGRVICQLRSSWDLGTAFFTVKWYEIVLNDTTTVEMNPGAIGKVAFTTQPPTIPVNTLSPAFLKVQTQDAYGHPIAVEGNTNILLSSTSGINAVFYIQGLDLNWSESQGDTLAPLADGQHTLWFKYKDSQAGQPTISVQDQAGNWTAANQQVSVVAELPHRATISAGPTSIVADGQSTALLTITVYDQYNALVSDGSIVKVTTDLGATITGTGGTVSGVLTRTLQSGTQAGQPAITVTDDQDQPLPGGFTWIGDPLQITSPDDPPAPPTNVNASASGSGIEVTWTLSADDGGGDDDVTGYEVWRKEGASGTFEKLTLQELATGTATYMDTNASQEVDYYYKVRALDAAGGADSNVFGPIRIGVKPPDPMGLEVEKEGDGEVELKWDQIVNPSEVRYHVYRSGTENGIYYRINTNDITNFSAYQGKVYFTDWGLNNGTTYYYKVRSFHNGVGSENFSGIVSAKPDSSFNFDLDLIDPTNIIDIGSTAKYYIQLFPSDQFKGTINLTCSGLAPGLNYEFLLNGVRMGSSLSGIVPPASVTLEVTAGSAAPIVEEEFEVSAQNVWQGGSSEIMTTTLRLTIVPLNEEGIHVEVDKTDVRKGEEVKIYGSILPPIPGKNVIITVTNLDDQSSEQRNVTTEIGGKFEDKEWIKTLDIGTYDVQASWTDDFLDAHNSDYRVLTVYKGQAVVTCHQLTGQTPVIDQDFTVLGDTEPGIPFGTITLRAFDPDSGYTDYTKYADDLGRYQFTLPFFTMNGIWKFKAYWTGNADYIGGESDFLVVPVGVDFGRAIIIGGGMADETNTYWALTKTLIIRAYKEFRSKGFNDEMIWLMLHSQMIDLNNNEVIDQDEQNLVDVYPPTAATFLDAIRNQFVNDLGPETPLFIYMQGHGTSDGRFQVLGADEMVSADQIDDALDQLQGIDAYAAQGGVDCKVILILESCYSGNFIGALSGPNRIILTSAGGDPYNTDSTGRSTFSRHLFSKLSLHFAL